MKPKSGPLLTRAAGRAGKALLLAGLLLPAVHVHAQQEEPEHFRLLTSEPEADREPTLAVSGGDVWMAFSSERDGNAEIYAIQLSEALREAPRLLMPDPASDHTPKLSPDGKWLAWVSDREDALGDIWVVKFPGGSGARQVSERGERDGRPRWSADGSGNLVLTYEVTRLDGTTERRGLSAGSWRAIENYQEPGDRPAPPLEFPAAGEGAAGTSASGAPVYVVPAWADDTDGDGQLGSGDDASVWLWDAPARVWRQMTPPLEELNSPQIQMGRLVLSAELRNNEEVVDVISPYEVAKVTDAADGLKRAEEFGRDRPLEAFHAIGIARQGYLLASDTEGGQRALLFALDLMRENARPEAALRLTEAAARRSAILESVAPEFEYRKLLLEVDAAQRSLASGADWRERAREAREKLGEMREAAADDVDLRARLGLEMARLSMRLEETERAVALAQSVEGMDGAPAEVRAEAMLVRARVYRNILPAQAESTLKELIRKYADQPLMVEQAALELAEAVQAGVEEREARILALREAASRAKEQSAVQAATRLVEGRLFAESGNPAEAAQSYRYALQYEDEQPLLGARVSFALAELLSQQANYAQAIETYEGVAENLRDRFFRGAPDFIRRARENLVRQLQTKGNFELRVNDPHLARATFAELTRRRPEIAEGWRGLIEAENRIGLLTSARMAEFQASAQANPDSAIEQYKYGMALTYEEPMPKRAEEMLRRAIIRDGSVPYYHQTLGFVHEHYGRIDNDRGRQADALQEYQRALALLDAAARPEDYANLLINAGNAGLAMGNNSRAVYFYQRWKDQAVNVTDPRTEFLFYRSFGIALFRSGRPTEAATAFETAIEKLDPLEDRQLLSEERLTALETELIDRRALALMESGELRPAAELFEDVAERHPENSLNRVRALRNRGVALHRLAMRQTGIDRELARRQAEESLTAAAELIRSPRLTVEPGMPEDGGGLFGLSLTMGTGEGGSAQQGFSKQEEERLLSAALARVQLESGRPGKGIDELRSFLSVKPELNDGNRAYYATARLVALDQLARELHRAGQVEEATDVLREGIETARFEVGGEAQYNAGGLSRVLTRLAETALLNNGQGIDAGALKKTWLGEDLEEDEWTRLVDAMLARALRLRDTADDARVIDQPAARARLLLSRALLAERMADGGGGSGMDALRAAADRRRAELLASEIIELAREAATGGEIKRLALLAQGVRLRAQATLGASDALAAMMDEAQGFAVSQGHAGMVWWLRAQPLVSNASLAEAEALDGVLADLEAVTPGEFEMVFDPPYDLLAHLQRLRLKLAVDEEDWEGAWFLAERWRVQALRFAFDAATPPTDLDDPADAEWARRFIAARESLRDVLERWRGMAMGDESISTLSDYEKAKARVEGLVEEGRAAELRSAYLLAPRASELADAEFLIAGGLAVPEGASLVMNTPWGGAAWSLEGFTELPDPAALASHAERSPIWFVMGKPMTSAQASGATVVNLLTFETTFSALYDVRFDTGEAFVDVGAKLAANPDAVALKRELAGEPNLEFPAVRMHLRDPFTAFLGETPVQLGSVLPQLDDAVQARSSVESVGTAGPNRRRYDEASVAAALAHGSLASAELGEYRWIGGVFPPEQLPEAAEAEVAGNRGLLTSFLQRDEMVNALGPARKLYLIQKALNYPAPEVGVTGTVLAQIEQRLGRLDAAVGTASEVVSIRREEGDPVGLISSLRRLGNIANDARQFEQGLAAYDEVIALEEELGGRSAEWIDAQAAAGAILENWGKVREAIERFELARDAAEALGDPFLQAQQWSRIGRIELRWLNRYEQAASAFAEAERLAAEAGAVELELSSRLDQARVMERIGDYDGAVEVAEAVRDAAAEGEMPLLESDAILVASSIEWARADYFKAFKYQREAMELIERIDDRPMRIIALNRAGLIYWALNDAKAALKRFNEALDLASRGLDLGEVASTYNNRGLVYRQQEQHDEALADFAKAQELDERQSNAWGLGYSTRNTGMTYLQMGEPAQALGPIQAAIGHSGEIGDVTNLAKALLALGDVQRELGEPGEAETAYRKAIEHADRIPLPEVHWRALFGLANLDLDAGNRASAKGNLEAAIEIVERLRARIKIEEFQDGFLQDKQELYDQMVSLLLDEGEVVAAFNFSERSRGRSFIDLLGNQKIEVHSPQDAEELKREKELRARMSELERRLGQLEDEGERADLEAELEEAQRAYQDFLIDLRLKNPQIASFVEVPTQDVESLQELIEPSTKVLIYHVLPDELVSWVIGKDTIQSTRTPVERSELAGRIQGFRQRLQNFDDIDEELAILSRLLLEPNLPLLGDAEQVCVVPHRELHRMPFAALQVGLENLVDRYALFYSPSSSVLRYTYARSNTPAQARPAAPRVLAIGNPDLGSETLALPFAEKEAERIRWSFPEAQIVTGDSADETWLRENSGQFDSIHLATHGEYDASLPLLSSILLGEDERNDGRLTAQEIFSMNINANFVALSACQSGLGKLSNGDDIVGLNRAFVYAGTRQLLSTLWRVDDVSTAVLVKHFYRNSARTSRAEALRQAQLEVRRRYPHPAHWSGIFLSGDWK